jgi:hypothetical protein
MNKKLKIVFMVVITAALVLAVNIPALAYRTQRDSCGVWWPVKYPNGEIIPVLVIFSEYGWNLEGNIIAITCSGVLPLGENLRDKSQAYYLPLDEARTFFCPDNSCVIGDLFTIGPDQVDWETTTSYKGAIYTLYDWELVVYDDEPGYEYGEFYLWKLFDISP